LGCRFKDSCAQFKNEDRTSLYQGANQCQTTLLLEQLVVVSLAFNAAPSQRELISNAEHLPQREKPNAVFMAGPRLDQGPSKAESVAPRLKPFTAMKRAKRDQHEQTVCVGFFG
jgi:hypothetical protein